MILSRNTRHDLRIYFARDEVVPHGARMTKDKIIKCSFLEMNKNTCLFVIQISQSRSFYAVYMEGLFFFMKKYMVWLISALMAVSMTACSNTQKKDTKDQAQITTAAKENETQTEAAKNNE